MICPVQFAREVTAWRAVRQGNRTPCGAGKLLGGWGGAGDEGAGSDLAGRCEEITWRRAAFAPGLIEAWSAIAESEPAALSGEAEGRTPDRAEPLLDEGRAAGSGTDGAGAQAGSALQTASATAAAGRVVTHRRQPSAGVSRRALMRPDRDSR